MTEKIFFILLFAIYLAAAAWAWSTAQCPVGQKAVRAVIAFTCVPK